MLEVVHVKWTDPCHAESGWMKREEFLSWIKEPASPADTVGILAYENDEFIIVIQSIGDGVVANGVKITRSSIQSIEALAKVLLTLNLKKDQ